MRLMNKEFWHRRAEQELTLAADATDERVVKAHYLMLGYYLDLLYGPDHRQEEPAGRAG